MNTRKRILSGLALFLAAITLWPISACTTFRKLTLSKQEKIMFESFRNQVHESVADPVRAEQLIDVGENLAFKLHDYLTRLSKAAKKCKAANADFDTTPEQLEACYRKMDDYRRDMRETVLSARSQAVSLATAAEWRALSNRQNSLRDFLEQAPGLF